MSVSEQDVRHIAALARLEIADDRVSTLVRELNGILVHMDVLQRVDMSSAAPASQPDSASVLRSDVPGSVPLARAREEFAPAMEGGFFLVPRLATHE